MNYIPFNRPFRTGNEISYIKKAFDTDHISGNGRYTKQCQQYICDRYGFKKTLLVNSCTDALEMTALLGNLKEGDEVIMPSYTFPSTANAFILRGVKVVFADSSEKHPNIDPDRIEDLITSDTKAIVVVHYSGVACDMDKILAIASKYNICIIEDAAHAIDSYYKDQPLGSIGEFGTFSFHETKNITSGEGGALIINDESYFERAEVIWEKGTNRTAFYKGKVDEYNWIDIGSSFLPSEITAAFLYAQLEHLDKVQQKRVQDWSMYFDLLKDLSEKVQLPHIPDYATNNGSMFYLVCRSKKERNDLIRYLKQNNVEAVFHYFPLHLSPFYKDKHDGRDLTNAERFSDQLIRLPLYFDLKKKEINYICDLISRFF